jgi:hypothetical protein
VLDVRFYNEICAFFRRGTPGFNTLELKILRGVEVQLSSLQAERLQRRIQQVNLVQRLDGGREVNSYQMRGGQPTFDESTRLTDSPGEHAFARFAFKLYANAIACCAIERDECYADTGGDPIELERCNLNYGRCIARERKGGKKPSKPPEDI